MIASPPISLPSTEIQSSPPCHLTLFIIHTVCNIVQRRNSLSQHKIPRQQGTTRRGTLERGEKLLDMHAPIPESVNPKEATSNTARVSYSSFLSFWHARMPRQCEYDYLHTLNNRSNFAKHSSPDKVSNHGQSSELLRLIQSTEILFSQTVNPGRSKTSELHALLHPGKKFTA